MFTAIAPDRPISSTSLNESVRPTARDITITPVAPPTPVEAAASNLHQRQPNPQPTPKPPVDVQKSGSTFAAAILAGALAPRPATLSELYARIGASPIPEDSELRLRDLQV